MLIPFEVGAIGKDGNSFWLLPCLVFQMQMKPGTGSACHTVSFFLTVRASVKL